MEIEGRLLNSILFPGDILKCVVVATCSHAPYNLAWLSFQIHGQVLVDPSWAQLPPSLIDKQLVQGQGLGSFLPQLDPKGYLIFSSPQTLIMCDVSLPKGKSKSALCSLKLPTNLFPTFHGTSVRYSYHVTLIGQGDSGQPQIIRFPFRILNPEAGVSKCLMPRVSIGTGFEIKCEEQAPDLDIQSLVDNFPSNAGRLWSSVPLESENSILSITEKKTKTSISQLFATSGSKVINIKKENQHVAAFGISSVAFKVGDTIKGHFDFTDRQLLCHQVLVTLQYVEVINPEYRGTRTSPPIVHTCDSFVAFTQHTLNTSFTFELPFSTTPQFSTELVEIVWSLEVQFAVANSLDATPSPYGSAVDVIQWSLPLRVLVPQYPQELDTGTVVHKKNILKF